jgi:glucose-6-phosphate 1-dehydrogenase
VRSFLPRATQIVGYARTALTDEGLHERLAPYLKGEEDEVAKFLKLCFYVQGDVSKSAVKLECTCCVAVLRR